MQNLRTYCLDVAQKIGINSAILLNQIIYWQSKSKNADKSFYKLDSEWVKELGFASVWVVRRAKKKLIEHGYIDTNYRLHNNKRTTVIYLIKQAIVKDFPDLFVEQVKHPTTPPKTHRKIKGNSPNFNSKDSQARVVPESYKVANIANEGNLVVDKIKADLFRKVDGAIKEPEHVIQDRINKMKIELDKSMQDRSMQDRKASKG